MACPYRNENYTYVCPHKPLSSGFCVFHDRNENKHPKEFEEELHRYLSEQVDLYRLVGFIFPKAFSKEFFKGRVISNHATFFQSRFPEEIDFSGTQFQGDANFSKVQFLKNTSFFEANVKGEARFSKTEFQAADFGTVQFSKTSDFRKATFLRDADFSATEFLAAAYFSEADFSKHANFSQTRFSDKVNFSGAQFSGDVSFAYSTFKGVSDFSEATFGGRCIFDGTVALKALRFNRVTMEQPERVYFRSTNLGKVSLITTDVSKFNFINVFWPTVRERYLWFFRVNRRCVCDELLSNGKREGVPALLEALYRQLKKNYEDSRNYGEAGDFHIGEMEMRRRQLAWRDKASWKNKDFYAINLYKLFSYYGENWGLAFAWVLLVIVVPTMFYMVFGLKFSAGGEIKYTWQPSLRFLGQWFRDFFDSLMYSLRISTLQRPTDVFPIRSSGRILSGLQGVLGPSLIALFLLALRRRFKR